MTKKKKRTWTGKKCVLNRRKLSILKFLFDNQGKHNTAKEISKGMLMNPIPEYCIPEDVLTAYYEAYQRLEDEGYEYPHDFIPDSVYSEFTSTIRDALTNYYVTYKRKGFTRPVSRRTRRVRSVSSDMGIYRHPVGHPSEEYHINQHGKDILKKLVLEASCLTPEDPIKIKRGYTTRDYVKRKEMLDAERCGIRKRGRDHLEQMEYIERINSKVEKIEAKRGNAIVKVVDEPEKDMVVDIHPTPKKGRPARLPKEDIFESKRAWNVPVTKRIKSN